MGHSYEEYPTIVKTDHDPNLSGPNTRNETAYNVVEYQKK